MPKKANRIKNKLINKRENLDIEISDSMRNPDNLSDEQKMWNDRSEENESNRLRVDKIKQMLHKLTPNELQVVQLLGNGHTHQEVSSLLEISTGNVYNLLARAQKKIKKFVGQNPD